jgi:hypothetical protein
MWSALATNRHVARLECGRKQGLRLTVENIQVMLIEERGSIDSAYLPGHVLDSF